jgi:hypothetical protein
MMLNSHIQHPARAALAVAICLAAALFSGGCRMLLPASRPVELIRHGQAVCVVVCEQDDPVQRFAARELVEIVNSGMGVQLETIDVDAAQAVGQGHRILIGRNDLVRRALGDALLDSLEPQESLVTSRGNDLILVGGDGWGTVYAVYDFLENEAGYRNFLPAPGGDFFPKSDHLSFSGIETRRKMVFKGFRDGHPRIWPGVDREASAKFFFRNRMNLVESLHAKFAGDSGLKEQFRFSHHTHGFFLYFDWKATFAEHPEYYTLNKEGERVGNAQMCLSNPDTRTFLTARVLETIEKQHTNGINSFVFASNDFQGSRYCWCTNCLALEKKYDSTGGPLWDYLLDLLAEVHRAYPNVFISTLAYKGLEQTEKAPKNIVFPDNFIADCAFLNCLQTLREIPAETLENGERFQKFENLLQWKRIAKHVSYWFYGHATGPTAIHERPAKELKELRDAGVESIFTCAFGGDYQFGAVSRYVTLRLQMDPDQDARALAKEAAVFLYGPAADRMMLHMDEVEKLRFAPGLSPIAANPYPAFTMLAPEQILRWRRDFDEMERLTAGDEFASFNIRVARTAADIWSLLFLRKIQREFPDFKPDIQALVDKGLATCDEMTARKLVPQENEVRQAFESLRLFAYLKDDALPGELGEVPPERVIRLLPGKAGRGNVLVEDADAIAGHASRATIPDGVSYPDGVGFEFYDALEKQWLLTGQTARLPLSELAPNRYRLYRVGIDRLPQSSRFVVGKRWGTGVDIDTLSTYYDPDHHQKQYEIWMSLKFEGPAFDPQSEASESAISWDQLFLVDKGVRE